MSLLDNSTKRLCILSFSDIARDGRVLRQIHFASRAGFLVDVIGYGKWANPTGVNFLPIKKGEQKFRSKLVELIFLVVGRLFPKLWEIVYWRNKEYLDARALLLQKNYDLIHANDWDALPVAGAVHQVANIPILYDAHEYTLEQEREIFRKRIFRKPYQKYLLKTYGECFSKMITVSDGISRLYAKEFGWNPIVIRNVPSYKKHNFRAVNPHHIKLIHHGGAIKGRNIEALIELMSDLDQRFYLYLMLVESDLGYLQSLKDYAQKIAPERIKFLEPVPPAEITEEINEYDIGIHLMKADNLNHYHALPNKLFEFIMAGLAVAVFPLPAMAKIVKENRVGVTSKEQNVDTMVDVLNNLDHSEIEKFKQNSLLLAKSLNAETEMAKLVSIYQAILASN